MSLTSHPTAAGFPPRQSLKFAILIRSLNPQQAGRYTDINLSHLLSEAMKPSYSADILQDRACWLWSDWQPVTTKLWPGESDRDRRITWFFFNFKGISTWLYTHQIIWFICKVKEDTEFRFRWGNLRSNHSDHIQRWSGRYTSWCPSHKTTKKKQQQAEWITRLPMFSDHTTDPTIKLVTTISPDSLNKTHDFSGAVARGEILLQQIINLSCFLDNLALNATW